MTGHRVGDVTCRGFLFLSFFSFLSFSFHHSFFLAVRPSLLALQDEGDARLGHLLVSEVCPLFHNLRERVNQELASCNTQMRIVTHTLRLS